VFFPFFFEGGVDDVKSGAWVWSNVTNH